MRTCLLRDAHNEPTQLEHEATARQGTNLSFNTDTQTSMVGEGYHATIPHKK